MIAQQDAEIIRRVYRIRRLLTSHEKAAEETFRLAGGTREEILVITEDENRRRKNLLSQIANLESQL
jgi:hypothetical protein